jgi:hypothetical protein
MNYFDAYVTTHNEAQAIGRVLADLRLISSRR